MFKALTRFSYPLLCSAGLLIALLACRSSKEKEEQSGSVTAKAVSNNKTSSASSRFAAQIDPLTPATVLSRLRKQYQHRGFKVMKEQTLPGGDWMGTVVLGKGTGKLEVFRVVLSDVSSNAAGLSKGASLRKAAGRNPIDVRAGNKKLLVVTCVGYRAAHRGDAPGSCAGKNLSGPRYVREAITKP